MATGNMLQGQARGKVGDIVFSVVKGQQVSKVYNAKPANPKTDAQITQRVKLGAAVGFYKRNTQFFPFAFQKQAKESDYNAFVRENINVSPYISRQGVVGNQIIPAPYQMTRGNLPEVATKDIFVDAANKNFVYTISASGITATSKIKALMGSLGAQVGDMLSFYYVASTIESASSLVASNKILRGYAKYTFKVDDLEKTVSEVDWDESNRSSEASLFVSSGSAAGIGVIAPFAELASEFTAACACSGFTVQLSRKVSGASLEVSSAAMKLSALAQTVYERYRSEAMLQEAKNSYGVKQDAFLSPQKPNVPQP